MILLFVHSEDQRGGLIESCTQTKRQYFRWESEMRIGDPETQNENQQDDVLSLSLPPSCCWEVFFSSSWRKIWFFFFHTTSFFPSCIYYLEAWNIRPVEQKLGEILAVLSFIYWGTQGKVKLWGWAICCYCCNCGLSYSSDCKFFQQFFGCLEMVRATFHCPQESLWPCP